MKLVSIFSGAWRTVKKVLSWTTWKNLITAAVNNTLMVFIDDPLAAPYVVQRMFTRSFNTTYKFAVWSIEAIKGCKTLTDHVLIDTLLIVN